MPRNVIPAGSNVVQRTLQGVRLSGGYGEQLVERQLSVTEDFWRAMGRVRMVGTARELRTVSAVETAVGEWNIGEPMPDRFRGAEGAARPRREPRPGSGGCSRRARARADRRAGQTQALSRCSTEPSASVNKELLWRWPRFFLGTPKRNDPCWCGSGKKYKKCHLDQDADGLRSVREVLPQAMAQFARDAERRARVELRLREQYGIYINYVTPVHFQGRKVWAIGTRLYPNNPPNQTYAEFLVSVLGTELGDDWLAEQNALPQEEQHFLRRAYTQYFMWQRREAQGVEQDADGLWSTAPDGWTQYLLSVAFDDTSLIQTGGVPEGVMQRCAPSISTRARGTRSPWQRSSRGSAARSGGSTITTRARRNTRSSSRYAET